MLPSEDELTPEQKFAAENPETMVPRELSRGRSREDLVAELVRFDWTPEAAAALVDHAADDIRRYHASPESREELVREARRQVVAGLLITLLGLGVTAFTFLSALAGALGFYVVAWGAVLGGLVMVSRGWPRWRLYRKAALPFEQNEPVDERSV